MEEHTERTTLHSYVLEPGDGTRYWFHFSRLAKENYLLVIEDPISGWGAGVINRPNLRGAIKDKWLGYVRYLAEKAHGFNQTHKYTLVAVLEAVDVLLEDVEAVEEAKKAMLNARDWFVGAA